MSAEGAKNVSWPCQSPLRGWGSLTMAFTGKVDIWLTTSSCYGSIPLVLRGKSNSSSSGSAIWELSSDYLNSSNLKTLRTLLSCCTNTDNNSAHWIDLENDHNSSLSLKPSSNLELLVNQFYNATPENSNDPEKVCSSKYYDIEEMHNIEIPHKNKLLSLFHINACSLNKNFDDLQHLLNCTKIFLT